MTIDPRLAVVERRLAGVRRVLPVTGGKGGIGKSVVATLLALVLSEQGKKVGLLDLDLTGPCDHLILGTREHVPVEEFGVEPQNVGGLRFMSVSTFAGQTPAPLRGGDLSNALLEILAITRWGELDFLVVDMPPGLSDAALDVVRLVRRAEYLVVATSSQVVLETVRRNLALLRELRVSIAGVVQNMQRNDSTRVRELTADFDLRLLGALPYDEALEGAIGDRQLISRTRVANSLRSIAKTLMPETA